MKEREKENCGTVILSRKTFTLVESLVGLARERERERFE